MLLRFEKDGVASGMGSEYEVLLRRSTAFLGVFLRFLARWVGLVL